MNIMPVTQRIRGMDQSRRTEVKIDEDEEVVVAQ